MEALEEETGGSGFSQMTSGHLVLSVMEELKGDGQGGDECGDEEDGEPHLYGKADGNVRFYPHFRLILVFFYFRS